MLFRSGRVLLHETVADALATHRMATDGPLTSSGETIGAFSGPDGERLTLLRIPSAAAAPEAEASGLRRASLEEVVLGYLASGRARPGEAAAA